MPELPDLANFKKYLDATGLHRRIAKVDVREPRVVAGSSAKDLAGRLTGHSFEASERHGKYLFVELDDGGSAVFHFGMTGRFSAYDDPEDEPAHSRVRFDFDDGGHLSYVNQRLFGEVRTVEDRDAFVRAKELGPDALDDALDEPAFHDLFKDKGGAIKTALTDQSAIAGLGNIYADEILFQAGLHPKTPMRSLKDSELGGLYRIMRRVLETAIERGAGSEDGLEDLPRGWLLPRREEGIACPRCETEIESIKISGRTSYFCPTCQPAP